MKNIAYINAWRTCPFKCNNYFKIIEMGFDIDSGLSNAIVNIFLGGFVADKDRVQSFIYIIKLDDAGEYLI